MTVALLTIYFISVTLTLGRIIYNERKGNKK